jgi:hypothetical protein
MKVIFLDIDGVICNQNCWKKREASDMHHVFDEDCVTLLNQICLSTDAKIVISSTWRRGIRLKKMRKIFIARGFKYPARIIDYTPCLNTIRGLEIREWIMNYRRNDGKNFRKLDNYVIIDDDCDMLYEQKDNFVKTDTYLGLQPEDVAKAIEILNK